MRLPAGSHARSRSSLGFAEVVFARARANGALVAALPLVMIACTRTVDLGENLPPGGGDASSLDATVDPKEGGPSSDATVGGDSAPLGDASTTLDGDGAVAPQYVFVTRGVYDANMGGIAGADSRCQLSAGGAGLKGVYRAWISDSNTDAKTRITGSGPWLEVGTNKVMFPTPASLAGFPEGPLVRDEYGDPAKDRWWTGTAANGIRHPETCINWASNAQFQGGMTGTRKGSGRPGNEWTEDVAYACTSSELQKFALICFGPM